MKRKIILAVLMFLCFVLQTTLFRQFAVASIVPNLLLILTVSFAFMRGKKEGLFVGFFCGLFMDLSMGELIGVNAMIYMCVGYANGFCCHIFYDDDIRMPIFFVALSDLAYGTATYLMLFLLRGRLDFFYYLGRIIIPEVLYTVIVTILIYKLLYRINRWLEAAG